MTELSFIKVEGLGNDFLLVDRRDASLDAIMAEYPQWVALAPLVCHRRTGVGADGLLILGPPQNSAHDAAMGVINHDGSRPEMCGNGLRCIALVAAGAGQHTLVIETDAGPKRCVVRASSADRGDVEVDMGPGRWSAEHRPAVAQGRVFDAVSMGNPHAITFVGDDEDPCALAHRLGPAIETAAEFPHGTNVEFARVEPDGVRLWVWERGCGITEACGTGACATAVAAARRQLVPFDTPIEVNLPGGSLTIRVPAAREAGVQMQGPARRVFTGIYRR